MRVKNNFNLDFPDKNFWVFGYGSLMWNPEFDHQRISMAKAYGYSRRLCLKSVLYRGTHQKHGLILGLDQGGSCQGVAFQTPDHKIDQTVDYLMKREMKNNLYKPIYKHIYLNSGEKIKALMYVSKKEHPLHIGQLELPQAVKIIKTAKGERGSNAEYVINTYLHLKKLGIVDRYLQSIVHCL